MRVLVASVKPYDHLFLVPLLKKHGHSVISIEAPLNSDTAIIAKDCDAVCVFVNDHLNSDAIAILAQGGVRVIALRCAGFNQIDLNAARINHISVVRVPAYSPNAVAEHAIGLLLCLNRRIHRAYNRVREGNFSLAGLVGFDLYKKTVGIIGTGRIGAVMARICLGFGCKVLANDIHEDEELKNMGVQYVERCELYKKADIISLHCPLTPETHYLINEEALSQMKPGVVLVNTSRGALIDTKAVLRALKRKQMAGLAIDVYEEEGDLFFEDLSGEVLQDDVFARLTTFSNVLITGHQAFLTHEALASIARTTVENIDVIQAGSQSPNEII